MSNGSMQFLGRQLTEQAKSMGELINQMKAVVKAFGAYSIVSDTVQEEKIYGAEINGKKFNSVENILSISIYMEGYIRLEFTAYSDNASGGKPSISVKRNGASVGGFAVPHKTSITKYVDIAVSEGDEIEINNTSSVAQENLYLEGYKIKYDFITRPDHIVTEL